jgi:hypothetical protein
VAFRNPLTSLPASSITGNLPASQISGQLTDSQIAGVSASKLAGTVKDSQIAGMSTNKLSGHITGPQLDSKALDNQTATGLIIDAGTFRTGATGKMRWELNSATYDKLAGYTGDVAETGFGGLALYADSGGLKTVLASPVLSTNDPAMITLTAVRSPAGNTEMDLTADTIWLQTTGLKAGPSGNPLPLGKTAYAKVTASTATTTTAQLVAVSATGDFLAGHTYKILCHLNIQSTVANDNAAVVLRVNGVSVGVGQVPGGLPAANTSFAAELTAIYQPAADAYGAPLTAAFYRTSGTGNLSGFANAGQPMFVIAEDVGA